MKLLKLFITYLKQNHETNEVYSGRASGIYTGDKDIDAVKIMKKRDSSHHKNKDGFDVGFIDKISFDSDAIRGREQNLIDNAKEKGICGNVRNSISPRNKKRKRYLNAALKTFGTISVILYFLYLCNIL